jgi:hypothetical protein
MDAGRLRERASRIPAIPDEGVAPEAVTQTDGDSKEDS